MKSARSCFHEATVSNKVEFCVRALEADFSFAQLPEEARELTEKLYKFIEANNK